MADAAAIALQKIATALAEPNLRLLQRIVARLGPDTALAFLAETLAIEAAGGLLTEDGARQRPWAARDQYLPAALAKPGGAMMAKLILTGRVAWQWRWPVRCASTVSLRGSI